jgi:hypothetical protein
MLLISSLCKLIVHEAAVEIYGYKLYKLLITMATEGYGIFRTVVLMERNQQ